jgi:hypothetical protein
MFFIAFPDICIKASRSFQVIAVKRGHSFPPIWLKMILVNLPSAVRRLACARTPLATLIAGFGCFTAGVAFFVAVTRLFRGFVSLFGFLRFFICVPSHGTREPYAYLERNKVTNKLVAGTRLTIHQSGDFFTCNFTCKQMRVRAEPQRSINSVGEKQNNIREIPYCSPYR